MEDIDANCRLRHGLNTHCLVHIFHYLESDDLYTLGEMNEAYKQIINDFVIPKHEVNFDKLLGRRITFAQMFERYGTKIQKFSFEDIFGCQTFLDLTESLNKYCSNDQLKSVKIDCDYRYLEDDYDDGSSVWPVYFPMQCQHVEKLEFRSARLCQVKLSESLRSLTFESIYLCKHFDWTKLMNLTELHLIDVNDINAQNFIEFLCQRPNLEIFHHDADTFNEFTPEICDAMAKYCGNQIREYYGAMPPNQEISAQHSYTFLSSLKQLKTVGLTTHQHCGGDLIDAIKRLAENDTIETLHIEFSQEDRPNSDCIFQKIPDLISSDMRHFSHLKMFTFTGAQHMGHKYTNYYHCCDTFKILRMYSAQMLANVEYLTVDYSDYDWDFIKCATKLRQLELFSVGITSSKATEILSALESILKNRNNGQIGDDFIDLKFDTKCKLDLFSECDGRSDSIKLSFRNLD